MPSPTTKKQLRTFLKLLGYCRLWLNGLRVRHLSEVPKDSDRQSTLVRGPEQQALELLKRDLTCALALGLPQPTKPYQLSITEKQGVSLWVVTQALGPTLCPIGYLPKN